jgi:uncharacterized membrane protein YhaH (DUF805 family)
VSRMRLKPRARKSSEWRWALYLFGRFLQVSGLMITLVAATAFFGSSSTLAMLRMMLIGVLVFLPGWWLTRKRPTA